MDRWIMIGAAVAGGFGSLTFLRILGNELAVKNRQIVLQVEKEVQEMKRRAEEAEQARLQASLEEQRQKKGSL